MSEETNAPETNDGTWSGLKKTLIGTLSTAILAGGGWLTTTFFNGGEDEKESAPTQQVAPVINITNSNSSQQSNGGGTNTVIKERVIEKEVPAKSETPKPKKKEGDEFKEEAPKW